MEDILKLILDVIVSGRHPIYIYNNMALINKACKEHLKNKIIHPKRERASNYQVVKDDTISFMPKVQVLKTSSFLLPRYDYSSIKMLHIINNQPIYTSVVRFIDVKCYIGCYRHIKCKHMLINLNDRFQAQYLKDIFKEYRKTLIIIDKEKYLNSFDMDCGSFYSDNQTLVDIAKNKGIPIMTDHKYIDLEKGEFKCLL